MRKLFTFFFLIVVTQQLLFQTGCAHIVPPAGGDRDTLPPIPIKFSPLDSTLKFSGNKITIDFNEYIQLDKPFENVIVSPNPSKQPQVESRLRTLTIKLKDSLLPNTTYNIDFGSAVKDINEGNVLRDFIFVFSTGNFLDTRELHGKVILAETGKTDSTLIVILHKSLDDSTVAKQKPFYYTRVRGDGSFRFTNLPAGTFALYALKDANGNKQYDQKMELFAFLNEPVTITDTTNPVFLYAYSEEKDEPRPSTGSAAAKAEKKLLFQTNLDNKRQSLISPLEITFNTPLKYFDSTKISLVDTGYHPIAGYRWVQDSGEKTVKLQCDWKPSTVYKLISLKDFAADTLGNQIAKNDTIEFVTKRIEDYGSLRLDFKNFNKEKNPVLQFVQQGNIVKSFPITQNVWSEKLFAPGEYEIRVLYDDNKNGKWDAGKFFTAHKQPERVVLIEEKLAIHANWENENAIDLKE